jgi:hypothetical protein
MQSEDVLLRIDHAATDFNSQRVFKRVDPRVDAFKHFSRFGVHGRNLISSYHRHPAVQVRRDVSVQIRDLASFQP